MAMSGGVFGVASVFTSCIDAFSYFKLYQNATRDIEVILLKLDIEKARLLIWGENIGILSADRFNSLLLDEQVAELIRRTLDKIQELLTDSDKLRNTYGVRTLDSSLSRAVDYISAKSLGVFQRSATRFLARNAPMLEDFARGSPVARTKWAIHERGEFQELIIDLSHFVDRLFELISISRETLDREIIEDIESIIDVSRLNIVEEATENYPAYFEAARSARASTEAGTRDRRTVEERIRDVEGIQAAPPGHNASESGIASFYLLLDYQADFKTESHLSEIWSSQKYFVLTSPCRRQATDEPCDVRVLGSQVTHGQRKNATPHWDISSRSEISGNRLGDLIYRAFDISKVIRDEVESGILRDLLKFGTNDSYNNEATPEQEAFIQANLPLVSLYIYCSPCVCLIHTAISVCRRLKSPYVKVQLRPDSRLVSSCCSTIDRSQGMRSLYEWARDWEASAIMYTFHDLAVYLDMVWLDQRLEHLDYELPYNFREDIDSKLRFLILDEADCISHMVQRAPGRIPRATDIWHIRSGFDGMMTRTLFGRFIEYRPMKPITTAPRVQSSNPTMPIIPPYSTTLSPQSPGLRRPASPSSSASTNKRRRSGTEFQGTESELEGEQSVGSMAEEMQM